MINASPPPANKETHPSSADRVDEIPVPLSRGRQSAGMNVAEPLPDPCTLDTHIITGGGTDPEETQTVAR